jgi:hypothetical protein
MPELKLGTKFDCYNCQTKFYDLGKADPVCPKCGANQKEAAHAEAPAARESARRRRKADVPKAPDLDDDEDVEVAGGASEDLDEDLGVIADDEEEVEEDEEE